MRYSGIGAAIALGVGAELGDMRLVMATEIRKYRLYHLITVFNITRKSLLFEIFIAVAAH